MYLKVPGRSANAVWDGLTQTIKMEVVEVARYFVTMFPLRFEGPLYRLGSTGGFNIGPIVSPINVIYGLPTYSDPHVQSGINHFGGPFHVASDWLSSYLKSEMSVTSSIQMPDANFQPG